MKYFKTVILGAGLSGLSAGFFAESGSMANNDFIILEKENHPGGLCKSFNINNFIFDYTGHLFHYSDSFSKKFFQKILQKNINCLQRKAFIKIFNNFIPYPFQLNLSYLPSENNFKCLYSFIRSFYSNSVSNKNYLEWMNTYFGGEICKHFMIPYNKKLWKTDLSKITTDWFSNYMPMPKMEEVLKGAISKKNSFKGYNHKFYYPQKNGIGSLINYLFEKNKNKILLNYKIKHIDIQNKIIISADQKIKYENLITTIPLIEFLKLINNRNHFNNMISKLDYISVFNINYGIETSVNNQAHWIYFPEKKYDFYRAGFYHNFSEFSVPSKNHHSSYLEISYKGSSKKKQNKDFLKEIKKQFFEIGIYSENNSKICQQFLLDIKYAYVIFDRYRKEAIEYLTPIYKKNSIIPVGRYAEWDYSSMQDSIKSAHNAVSKL